MPRGRLLEGQLRQTSAFRSSVAAPKDCSVNFDKLRKIHRDRSGSGETLHHASTPVRKQLFRDGENNIFRANLAVKGLNLVIQGRCWPLYTMYDGKLSFQEERSTFDNFELPATLDACGSDYRLFCEYV